MITNGFACLWAGLCSRAWFRNGYFCGFTHFNLDPGAVSCDNGLQGCVSSQGKIQVEAETLPRLFFFLLLCARVSLSNF